MKHGSEGINTAATKFENHLREVSGSVKHHLGCLTTFGNEDRDIPVLAFSTVNKVQFDLVYQPRFAR
jgi:hypothetical protein